MSRKPRRGEDSAEINRLLVMKYLKPKADGEEVPTTLDLAYELGITRKSVEKRLSRLRRGEAKVSPVRVECDCDENGPCITHFQQQLRSVAS